MAPDEDSATFPSEASGSKDPASLDGESLPQRAPHRGYWNDPETTAAAIRDGWLHSGDLGVCDDQGRIAFVDRLKP